MKIKNIPHKWKNIIWIFSSVLVISTLVGITFGTVKKDNYIQSYDFTKQIFDENEINKFLKIEKKDNISNITASDFASQFKKHVSLNSETLKQYTHITKDVNWDDYIIRIFNIIINKSDNSLNFMVEFKHKTTQKITIFQKIISGFKNTKLEKIQEQEVSKIKTTFTFKPIENKNINDWITSINKSNNPIEKTYLFSDLVQTLINREYVLYIVDKITKENNKISFKYKLWKLEFDRNISTFTQTFSDEFSSSIDVNSK
ncbi:hypothetical protein [Mycoplasma miroungirhinis]|uniref:Uncharacterized protein n=1 Tax=Mycoplasma miroungirhinis TaxID=754516 RepID=A0A6M4JBK4_9MOLU|nr:hypothetical protein [Mycoplasma miroungirhinis]QJR44344.1 hypothetical protein HLA92_02800 [Mycoplasma miroungirhinis]